MSTQALTKCIREARKITAEAASDYESLVRRLTADEEVPAGETLDVCESAGKSLDQLQADVERLVGRQRDAATLAGLPAAETARAAAGRKLAAETHEAERGLADRLADLERQRLAAHAARDSRIAAARAALDQAEAAVGECRAARERLTETADADLKAKVSEVRTRRQFALSRVGDARQRAEREDDLIRRAKESLPPAPGPNEITDPSRTRAGRAEAEEHANRIIGAAQQRRARAAESLREATAELAEIDDQIADAEAALLVP